MSIDSVARDEAPRDLVRRIASSRSDRELVESHYSDSRVPAAVTNTPHDT
jgi:hypothetical protein